LSKLCFIKVHQLENPGTQPEHLTAEGVKRILGGAS
jgi:hypothetical protein